MAATQAPAIYSARRYRIIGRSGTVLRLYRRIRRRVTQPRELTMSVYACGTITVFTTRSTRRQPLLRPRSHLVPQTRRPRRSLDKPRSLCWINVDFRPAKFQSLFLCWKRSDKFCRSEWITHVFSSTGSSSAVLA